MLWHLAVVAKHRPAILKADGVATIVAAMDFYPTDAVVQCHAAGALWNLALYDPEPVCAHDVIGRLVRAMLAHPTAMPVQRCCSGALWAMVSLRPDTAAAMAAAGAIPALLAALKTHMSPHVHRVACGVLKEIAGTVALAAAIVHAGGVLVVVESMNNHRSASDVLHVAARLLGRLADADMAQAAARPSMAALVQALEARISPSEVDTDAL